MATNKIGKNMEYFIKTGIDGMIMLYTRIFILQKNILVHRDKEIFSAHDDRVIGETYQERLDYMISLFEVETE